MQRLRESSLRTAVVAAGTLLASCSASMSGAEPRSAPNDDAGRPALFSTSPQAVIDQGGRAAASAGTSGTATFGAPEESSSLAGAAPFSPPAMVPASDVRDRQIEILTSAVAALREEVAKRYAHSDQLLEETKRVRRQLLALRRELSATRTRNEELENQIRTLENQLREVRAPPPDAAPASAPATADEGAAVGGTGEEVPGR